jgi:hypothetical protein
MSLFYPLEMQKTQKMNAIEFQEPWQVYHEHDHADPAFTRIGTACHNAIHTIVPFGGSKLSFNMIALINDSLG